MVSLQCCKCEADTHRSVTSPEIQTVLVLLCLPDIVAVFVANRGWRDSHRLEEEHLQLQQTSLQYPGKLAQYQVSSHIACVDRRLSDLCNEWSTRIDVV